MRFGPSVLVAMTATALFTAGGLLAAPAIAAPSAVNTPHVVQSCGAPVKAHTMRCFALRRTDVASAAALSPNASPSGLSPANLVSAYKLPAASTTATVAIVDAYDDPKAESDLATYRSQYGLPACTTANGCFKKVNQNGATSPLPSANTGWAGEISLDVDMVSAVCPSCHILLVEANSASDSGLYIAENTAAGQAKFVSDSWGGGEYSGQTSYDSYFNHPGVAITVSAGDDGSGASYPATSRYVTAVGGTSLRTASNSRGWTESAWSGSGSGCSGYDAKPSWQNVTTGCGRRAEADVSAIADPATGVAVYQTYGASGWAVYGGTSASSPIVASVYALAGTPGAGDTPASYAYAHAGNLFDVTSGSNGSCGAPMCNAGTGWDGPTGLGTPNGTAAFQAGGGTTPPPPPPTGSGSITGYGGKCVDVNGADSTSGTAVQLWDCNTSSAQQWTADSDGSLRALGKCLDITGNATANNSKVEIWDCNGGGNQVWQTQSDGTLRNPQSGRCLDDPGYSTTNGTQLIIWDCSAGANQKWTLAS